MNLDDLLEAWRVNNAVNLELLELCPDESMEFKPGKGKTIRSNFVHIIGTRGQWIEQMNPKAKPRLPKLDWKTATRQEIVDGLNATEEHMREVFRKRSEKPGGLTFFAYMIAHEAHHRSQVEIALRLNAMEPEEARLYGLWEWSKK